MNHPHQWVNASSQGTTYFRCAHPLCRVRARLQNGSIVPVKCTVKGCVCLAVTDSPSSGQTCAVHK